MKEFILLPLSGKFFPSISSWAQLKSSLMFNRCALSVTMGCGKQEASVLGSEVWDTRMELEERLWVCTDIFLLTLYTGFEVVIRTEYTQHKVTHTGL